MKDVMGLKKQVLKDVETMLLIVIIYVTHILIKLKRIKNLFYIIVLLQNMIQKIN